MATGLVLRAVEVAGPARWRWQLTDAAGLTVADHQVELDPASSEFEAFCDLVRIRVAQPGSGRRRG
ncbi:MAG TPA: hypothetical protein VFM54_21295 [Micromonosporaceae bacterium]|nr:hypothetical protein [Micromonosporaceae bacterium]